jgi:hypothetical protein
LFCKDFGRFNPNVANNPDLAECLVTGTLISKAGATLTTCKADTIDEDGDALIDMALTLNRRETQTVNGVKGWKDQDCPESIQLCSWFLNMCARWGYVVTPENMDDVRRTVAAELGSSAGLTQVDTLRTLEFVINHEVTESNPNPSYTLANWDLSEDNASLGSRASA